MLSTEMLNVEHLAALCTALQIVGFILIAFRLILKASFQGYPTRWTGPIISVTGFAAVVKIFLPIEGSQNDLAMTAAFAGILIIFIGMLITQEN